MKTLLRIVLYPAYMTLTLFIMACAYVDKWICDKFMGGK